MNQFKTSEILPRRKLKKGEVEILGLDSDDNIVGDGLESTVYRVVAITPTGGKISLIYKEFKHFEVSKPSEQLVLRDIFLNGDLPVPEIFIMVEQDGQEKGLLISDLTDNGEAFLLTSNDMKFITPKLKALLKTKPELISAIAKIEISHMSTLDQSSGDFELIIENLARKASKLKLKFQAGDILFWKIKKDSNVKPYFSDFGNVGRSNDSEEVLYERNLHCLRLALDDLKRIVEIAQELSNDK